MLAQRKWSRQICGRVFGHFFDEISESFGVFRIILCSLGLDFRLFVSHVLLNVFGLNVLLLKWF